jgi:PAS domain S-box-containing protein
MSPTTFANEKVNILIVDDQMSGLIAIEAVLQSPEYNLVLASSGREALKRIQEDAFALILLDVRMPGMDGFETAEIIKTHDRSRDIPIIFITGNSHDQLYIHKGYQSGAVDYLFKPFDAEILKSKVSVFIELYQKNKMIQSQEEQIRKSEIASLEIKNLERYRILANAIPHMVWEATPEGNISYFNRSGYDYTGLSPSIFATSNESAKVVPWKTFVHGEDIDILRTTWKDAMKQQASFEIECRIKRGSDGMFRWHLIRMIPEKLESGQTRIWIGTATDIHDRKQAEDEIRKAGLAAQEATQIKSDFLATMSHEIRTPMNSIQGMTGLLLDTPLTSEQREYTELIRESSATLLTLINDVLDFSKIESGKIELEVIDFDFSQLIKNCEKIFASMTEKKGIRLHTRLPDGIPHSLKGDSSRLQQVLVNLINNAIKFTNKGTVTISAHITHQNEKDVGLRVEVRDTGIGIPESAKGRMFQTFSQADSSTTRRFGGSGLGLSICKKLIETMGGEIGFQSQEGSGSTFWFTLTLEKGLPLNIETPEPRVNRAFGPRPTPRYGRILIEEDNTANQKLALRALEKIGYRADVVGDGNEVLNALREVPYDVILMDWQMPEMDGRKATEIIRSSKVLGRTDIPIIAMTANAMKGDREKCLEAGASDYLAKPVNTEQLFSALRLWLHR